MKTCCTVVWLSCNKEFGSAVTRGQDGDKEFGSVVTKCQDGDKEFGLVVTKGQDCNKEFGSVVRKRWWWFQGVWLSCNKSVEGARRSFISVATKR